MSSGLIPLIKQAAMDVIENGQMTDLRYGTVTGVSPVTVRTTEQFNIPASLLVVPEHLTNHRVSVTIDWDTELSGTKTMTIRNGLRVGDKVALLRKQGGQSYLILDRI